MQFNQIIGHADTKQVLINSVRNKHVAHAQLFMGAEGGANLALALAYATYLNCENKQETDSCGACSSCSKINKLVHPDMHFIMPVVNTPKKEALSQNFLPEWREFLLENPYRSLNDWLQFIGAENKQGNITKEEARGLLRLVSLKAFEAEFKIVLIWLPELLNPTSANALLKLLEEPPAQTIFLLVSNSPEKLLATILSRTQLVNVRAFTPEETMQYVQENFGVDEPKAAQVAQLSEGNLRLAGQLCTEMTSDYFEFFVNWMRLCFSEKLATIIKLSEDFQKLGRENQKNFLQYALSVIRRVMLFGVDPSLVGFVPPAEADFVSKFSKVIHANNVALLTNELNQAHYHIERNANPKMVFVDVSLALAKYLKMK
ncbi:DNA polymerase III subunit delta [Adhaeribacter sp. BT258]|uniref:DNA polymerase III subunit delta n=1 Tax=Adhaeribacter terrigena TaxID=2793070 RepID=A0ABS1BWM5_9BACT|nr:DNA polymerase III subunit delta [Adhaeribacter terrigena]MBK0401521.1 DNA polymerase III subunit delta [Adhaeribacter terrigena]